MKNKQDLSAWLEGADLAIPGKLRTVYLKCGKASCKCSEGKSSDKHGPYYFWDRKNKGKLTSSSIPQSQLAKFKKWAKNREDLEKIVLRIKVQSERLARDELTKAKRSTPSN